MSNISTIALEIKVSLDMVRDAMKQIADFYKILTYGIVCINAIQQIKAVQFVNDFQNSSYGWKKNALWV